MKKIYAIVNPEGKYYSSWDDSFNTELNPVNNIYYTIDGAKCRLNKLNEEDDSQYSGCKVVELNIFSVEEVEKLKEEAVESKKTIDYWHDEFEKYFYKCKKLEKKLKEANKNWKLDVRELEYALLNMEEKLKEKNDSKKKVVLNKCYGGFSLSKEAYDFLGLKWDGYGFEYSQEEKRTDLKLVECVEKLGKRANGTYADLVIVEIPVDLDYVIDDYDGMETLHQRVQEW